MAHRLQKRDRELIMFLEENKNVILNTRIASKLFYATGNEQSSMLVAGRRMEYMASDGYIKRHKPKYSNQYIYYNTESHIKASSVNHKLAVMELYALLSTIQGINIDYFASEYDALEKEYGLRPDLKCDITIGSRELFIFGEIDITKKFTNTDKYLEVLENPINHKNTLIISVCDFEVPAKALENLNIVRVSTELTLDDTFKIVEKINEMLKG